MKEAARRRSSGTSLTVLSTHTYYPFGMENEDLGTGSSSYDYRYNGKEFSEELGLYDYGARWYDPAIARWMTVDPLAESMSSWSPYNYTFNNPIRFTDPTGLSPQDSFGLRIDGTIFKTAETDDDHDILTAVDPDGDQGPSTQVRKGILDSYVENQKKETEDGQTQTSVEISGDAEAQKLFEFISENSPVAEIGLIQSGETDNTIVTSHEPLSNPALTGTARQMLIDGKSIRSITHSHPLDGIPSEPDIGVVNYFNTYWPKNGIIHRIYRISSKKYQTYDQNSDYEKKN